MRVIETKVFTYDELSDKAKEKAREWLAGLTFTDSSDWDHVLEDAIRMANIIGITIYRREYRTVGGAVGQEPCIYFSGFSSQGDGASFSGTYRYKAGAMQAIIAEAPRDYTLHRIAEELQAVQRGYFYKLTAKCTQRGHYSHSGCMEVEVSHDDDQYRDVGSAETEIRQLLRDFADWIYKQLESEYDYQVSVRNLEELMHANNYEFYEDGSRV